MIKVTDQRGHGIGDQAQIFFAASQRRGDALIGVVRRDETLVGRLQFGGALGHTVFQLGVLLLDLLFIASADGDVGIQRHEAVVRQGLATHRQNLPAGTIALGVVGGKTAGQTHALSHQFFNITRSVLPAFSVIAHEGFKGRADKRHLFGEIQQPQKRLVPSDKLKVGINHSQTLVEPIQSGLKQLVPVMGWLWVGRVVRRHER